MFRKVAPPVGGVGPPPCRRVVRPTGTNWFHAFILSDFPLMLLCHWSAFGKTAPCLEKDCRGCNKRDPWPHKVIGFACAREPAGLTQFTFMLPEDTWVELSRANVEGETWNGLQVRAKHATEHVSSRIVGEVLGRRPLGVSDKPWDMIPDLLRLWKEFLPPRWNGALAQPREPGQEG